MLPTPISPRLPPPMNFFPSLQKPPVPPIPHADLVKYYNQMFPTLNSYKSFMNRQLGIWEQDLQVKCFNSPYCYQWSTTNSIKTLRNQAQKLLEEANQLQERKHSCWQEINHHLHTITQPKLRRHLYKVYPWPTFPIRRQTQPTLSLSWPVLRSNPNPKKWTQLRCFQCDSPTHIKWNCPQYCCRYCDDMAPSLNKTVPKIDLKDTTMDSEDITISQEKKMGI